MKVLHISNAYSGSKVYQNLCRELDEIGIAQTIYTAVREEKLVGSNTLNFKNKNSNIIYANILNKTIDRAIYPKKINKILKDIQKKVDIEKVDLIHSHTWYSDGGVAYYLSKKYKVPFVVTIRGTDLNIFQKKMVYLRPFGRRILREAEKVFLISASYKDRVLNQSSLQKISVRLQSKIMVIPNGVDNFWIQNTLPQRNELSENIYNILYIGQFTGNKNVMGLLEAVIQLSKTISEKVQLHLVGGGGNKEEEVLKRIEKYPQIFQYHGQIQEKDKLKEIFQKCAVFAMPSFSETFGLVYVEALLQGLPILYRKGEGIDGFYEEYFGEAVEGNKVEEIREKLQLLYENYTAYLIPTEKIKANHNWKNIAKMYFEIYSKTLKQ